MDISRNIQKLIQGCTTKLVFSSPLWRNSELNRKNEGGHSVTKILDAHKKIFLRFLKEKGEATWSSHSLDNRGIGKWILDNKVRCDERKLAEAVVSLYAEGVIEIVRLTPRSLAPVFRIKEGASGQK